MTILLRLTLLDGSLQDAQERGWDATHNRGWFAISAFTRSPQFVGAVAQEYRELGREQKRGATFAAPALAAVLLAALALHIPAMLAVAAAAVAAFAAYTACENDDLALEAWSHATTVRANVRYDGLTLDVAEALAARSLQGANYGWAGQTIDQLKAMMRSHYADADAWLTANDALCRKWQAVKKLPAWEMM